MESQPFERKSGNESWEVYGEICLVVFWYRVDKYSLFF